jgi:succinyl-CoA synthetase beta subunit
MPLTQALIAAIWREPCRPAKPRPAASSSPRDHRRVCAAPRRADFPPRPRHGVGEAEALRYLQAARLSVVEFRLCTSAEAAVEAVAALNAPAVMKISSPDIAHKTEVGGVAVGITAKDDVSQLFKAMVDRAGRFVPGACIEGVIVAPMVEDFVEAIVGVERDPVFGPIVLVGLGGIHAEIFRDTSVARAPVTPDQARAMVESLRCYPLLAGARGQAPRDVEALARFVARASELAAAEEAILSLDVNPVAVLADGQGCLALDASLHSSRDG